MIVLLERAEEESFLSGLLDQYPALHRNAEMFWGLPLAAAGNPQVAENIQGICKLIDGTATVPAYAAEALEAVPPPWNRSPWRLLQFVKTFTRLHTKTVHSISSRCDVLKVSGERVLGNRYR